MDKASIKKIILYCMNFDFDYAEVFCENTKEVQMDYENEKFTNKQHNVHGLSITLKKGNDLQFETLKYFNIKNAYEIIDKMAENLNVKYNNRDNLEKIKFVKHDSKQNSTKSYKCKQKVLRDINLKISNEIVNTINMRNSIYEKKQSIYVASSNKKIVKISRSCIRLFTNIELNNNDKYFKSLDGTDYKNIFDIKRLNEYCEDIINNLFQRQTWIKLQTATYDILFSNNCGLVFHEFLGHILEYEIRLKRKQVNYNNLFNKNITIIDDPTIVGLSGSIYYDDESNRTCKKVLVEKGIVKNFLTSNLFNDNDYLCGNGRRADYNFLATSRMSNTYIKAGKVDSSHLFSKMKSGLYISKIKKGELLIYEQKIYIQ